MSEKCKNCEKNVDSGIWQSPQFKDEKVWLFCSEKCKEDFIKRKIEKIKIEYPNYYEKLSKDGEALIVRNFLRDSGK